VVDVCCCCTREGGREQEEFLFSSAKNERLMEYEMVSGMCVSWLGSFSGTHVHTCTYLLPLMTTHKMTCSVSYHISCVP
jgi:hypothetical protein